MQVANVASDFGVPMARALCFIAVAAYLSLAWTDAMPQPPVLHACIYFWDSRRLFKVGRRRPIWCHGSAEAVPSPCCVTEAGPVAQTVSESLLADTRLAFMRPPFFSSGRPSPWTWALLWLANGAVARNASFIPSAIPLAVKSPYLSAWLIGTNVLNAQWPNFWRGDRILGWAGYAGMWAAVAAAPSSQIPRSCGRKRL